MPFKRDRRRNVRKRMRGVIIYFLDRYRRRQSQLDRVLFKRSHWTRRTGEKLIYRESRGIDNAPVERS